MIRGAYTPSLRVQTAPFGRCWYTFLGIYIHLLSSFKGLFVASQFLNSGDLCDAGRVAALESLPRGWDNPDDLEFQRCWWRIARVTAPKKKKVASSMWWRVADCALRITGPCKNEGFGMVWMCRGLGSPNHQFWEILRVGGWYVFC